MLRKTKTEIRIEKIRLQIMRIRERKDMKCKYSVISHLYLIIDTLEDQEKKFLQTLS